MYIHETIKPNETFMDYMEAVQWQTSPFKIIWIQFQEAIAVEELMQTLELFLKVAET